MRRWPRGMVFLRRSPPAYPVSLRQKMRRRRSSRSCGSVAIVTADIDPARAAAGPDSLPAAIVAIVGVVGCAEEEREAMEAMMEEAVMEETVMEEGAMDSEVRNVRRECRARSEGYSRKARASAHGVHRTHRV